MGSEQDGGRALLAAGEPPLSLVPSLVPSRYVRASECTWTDHAYACTGVQSARECMPMDVKCTHAYSAAV